MYILSSGPRDAPESWDGHFVSPAGGVDLTTRCCIQLPWEAALNLKENKPGALSARGVVNLMEKPMNLRVKFNSKNY